MKKTKLTRSLLAACSIVALSAVMYGCTSDGSENDLIATQGNLEDVIAERDAALASAAALQMQLDTATSNGASLQTMLDDANTETMRIQGLLHAEEGNSADLQMQLDASIANAAGIQTMLDDANANGASLQTMLDDANANGASLQTMLDDANANGASLQTMLDDANAESMRIQGLLDAEEGNSADLQMQLDAAIASGADLQTQLDAAIASGADLQTQLDASIASGADLQTQLDASIASGADLQTQLDASIASGADLQTQLDASIASGADLQTQLDASKANADDLQTQLDAANARIEDLEAGTAPDVLDPIKTGASAAATAAGTASTAAGAAADAAEVADDNRATIQTGEANSVADAMYARTHADTAAAEAMKAQTASTAAQGAMTAGEATPLRLAAEAAQAAAEAAQADAEAAQAEAEADAMAEVKIVGDTKSVGDNEITVGEDTHTDERTINGVTTTEITGLVFDIETEGTAIDGTGDDADTPNVVEDPVPGADSRGDVEIGGWWDSVDDDARLALITKYAGTQTVTAFVDANTDVSGTEPNVVDGIDHDGDTGDTDATPVRTLPLRRASGTFMEAQGLTEDPGSNILAATTATTVYYYETSGGRVYVRAAGSTVADNETTYNYDVLTTRKGAKIPRGNDYEHLHFGLWADLKTIDSVTGDNVLDSLGIGFVTALADGDGMTEDMPNHGDARYNGNWVAAIQAQDEDGKGDISLEDGAAVILANFRKGNVEIGLTDFVTLDGNIEGNRFTGSYVDAELDFDDVVDDQTTPGIQALGNLNATGEYDGTVNGGFFGDDAEEIGGVFEFTSDDNEDGAFRGSFGGHEDEDVSID